MKGKDFVNSKWCKQAQSPAVQSKIKSNFNGWATRVRNLGILSRAKQLYQYFLSPEITGGQKFLVAGALLYILSPLDLIPDVVPIFGWLDDIGVATFALSYIFSQMDKLQEKNKKKQEELLEEDIEGTMGRALNFSPNGADDGFSVSVDNDTPRLQARLEELRQIAEKLKVEGAESFLGSIESRLASTGMQKLAVVGRYSTGKSTLINALLGTAYLPVAPTPTTKAITYIMRGKEDLLCSEDSEGNVLVHESVNELRDIYQKDIAAASKCALALANFPFPSLTIMDTPGLEDPDQAVVHRTLDALPEADAIVVLLDAGYLESKVEFEFIASLLKNDRDKKLFVVINKTDGKSPEEVDRLMKLCQSHLIGVGVASAKIFPVSAKLGVQDNGFLKFKTDLFSFLENGLSKEAYRHSKSELEAYSRVLLDACTNAAKVSALDRQQQAKIAEDTRAKKENIVAEYGKSKDALSKSLFKYRSEFFLEFDLFIDKLKASAQKEILASSSLQALKNTDAIALKLKQEIVGFVDKKVSEISDKLKIDLANSHQKLCDALAKFNVPINVEIRDYSTSTSLLFPGVVLTSFFFCGFFTFIYTFIAAVVGRKFFEGAISRAVEKFGVNNARSKIAEEVGKKLEEAKGGLKAKLNESFDSMEKEMFASFDANQAAALASVAFIEPGKTTSASDINECREKLTKMLSLKN